MMRLALILVILFVAVAAQAAESQTPFQAVECEGTYGKHRTVVHGPEGSPIGHRVADGWATRVSW